MEQRESVKQSTHVVMVHGQVGRIHQVVRHLQIHAEQRESVNKEQEQVKINKESELVKGS